LSASTKKQNSRRNAPLEIPVDALLSALPHPLLVLGEDLHIEYVNTAAEDFFQMSSAVLRRRALTDVVAFGSPLIALVEQVQRNDTHVNEYGVDLGSHRFDAPKLVDLYGGPLPEAPGRVLVMLQQRNMAQMIERQLTHRGAARSVSALAAVLAHEIKNPLSGIRGAAQLIESERPDFDRTLTQLICAESDRICKLVDRMEIFGDERPLQREPVNIHDVLDHVKHIARTGFARQIKIVEHYDPSLPTVPGSRDKLIQVFLNLVKNAAEAIGDERSDGQITLSTSFRPGVRLSVPGSQARVSLPLEIAVEDNGTGVPTDLVPHLFDPFVTTKPSGTGLGLALVAKIIGDHGGIIECDSRPRQTVFRALMPMSDGDQTQTGRA
jgi:two-component system, NtrC family, nitrogen regulation sensor histidine kinase GlnL